MNKYILFVIIIFCIDMQVQAAAKGQVQKIKNGGAVLVPHATIKNLTISSPGVSNTIISAFQTLGASKQSLGSLFVSNNLAFCIVINQQGQATLIVQQGVGPAAPQLASFSLTGANQFECWFNNDTSTTFMIDAESVLHYLDKNPKGRYQFSVKMKSGVNTTFSSMVASANGRSLPLSNWFSSINSFAFGNVSLNASQLSILNQVYSCLLTAVYISNMAGGMLTILSSSKTQKSPARLYLQVNPSGWCNQYYNKGTILAGHYIIDLGLLSNIQFPASLIINGQTIATFSNGQDLPFNLII